VSDRDPATAGGKTAVIGVAGRFPGSADVTTLWNNLISGVESISQLTKERLFAAGVADEAARDPAYVAASGVVADVDMFDAGYFGYTPAEAESAAAGTSRVLRYRTPARRLRVSSLPRPDWRVRRSLTEQLCTHLWPWCARPGP
jgi:hypothetical protein